MSIIHVNQIRNTVRSLFGDKIDLSDCNSDTKHRENYLLTRGLAAYVIHYLAQVDPVTAADAVTDGSDDNGLDAIYYDEREKRLYLIQSKWIHDGSGEPDNGDVKKFIAGVKDLFGMEFDRFNNKVRKKQQVIDKALKDPSTRYEIVLAYTGINKLAPPSSRDLKDLSDEMNDASDVLSISEVCLLKRSFTLR